LGLALKGGIFNVMVKYSDTTNWMLTLNALVLKSC